MFVRSGETTASCGVPSSVSIRAPPFSTPAFNHFSDETDDSLIANPVLDEPDQPFVADRVKERSDIGVENPADVGSLDPVRKRVQRITPSS